MRTVYLGTSGFAASVLGPLRANRPPSPVLAVTRPDRPAGRGRRLTAPPVAELARRPRHRPRPARRRQQPRSPPADRASRARRRRRVRVRRAPQGAAAERLRAAERPSVAVPALARRGPVERAIMAGDAETGVSIMRVDGGPRQRPRLSRRAPSRSAPTTRTGRSRARLERLGADLLARALDERPRARSRIEAT